MGIIPVHDAKKDLDKFDEEMEDYDIEIELTKEQKSAVRSLERAFKKCFKADIYFHNCYGTLIAYDGNVVESVNDDVDELSCNEGYSVDNPYSIDSWADDRHYIHLI